jgi:hypothetical protein
MLGQLGCGLAVGFGEVAGEGRERRKKAPRASRSSRREWDGGVFARWIPGQGYDGDGDGGVADGGVVEKAKLELRLFLYISYCVQCLVRRLRTGLLGEYATVQAQSDPREERREDS